VADSSEKQTICERDLRNWRLIGDFVDCLKKATPPSHPSFSDPRRRLDATHYLSLFLFGLFNPTVRTMRGLCHASQLKRVQEEVCGRRVSLGSFSEAQHLLEPKLLEEVFNQLASQLPQSGAYDQRLSQWEWLAQDGSLFAALPRMHWALYGAGYAGAPNRAARLHLSLNILEDKPQSASIRPGAVCERKVWKTKWKKGQAYVGDRLYGQDFRVFAQLNCAGCACVLRMRDQTEIEVLEELPISQADQKAGVQRQAWAYLGSSSGYRSVKVRVVWVATQNNAPLILVTNLPPEQLPGELVSLLYRWRWKIELFFRWIKCILQCRHWLAESPEGAAIQIYLALIAGLLVQWQIGKRPNKRLMELLQMHQQGWATDDELIAGLKKFQEQAAKKH
jgi:Transposase DDE domain